MILLIFILAITYLTGIGVSWQVNDSHWQHPGPLFSALGWPLMLPITLGKGTASLFNGSHRENKQIKQAKIDAEILKIRADAAVHEARETEAIRLRYETLGLPTTGFGDVNPKARLSVLKEVEQK